MRNIIVSVLFLALAQAQTTNTTNSSSNPCVIGGFCNTQCIMGPAQAQGPNGACSLTLPLTDCYVNGQPPCQANSTGQCNYVGTPALVACLAKYNMTLPSW